MQETLRSLIKSVNGRLDVKPAMMALGLQAADYSVMGARARSFCPVHKGKSFKSLQFDLPNRTCQCIVKECPAHAPLTVVELFARARSCSPAAAALEIAREQELTLDSALLAALRDRLLRLEVPKAAEAELAEAEELLACLVRGPLAGSPTPLRQLGSIRRRLGRVASASETFANAARAAEEAGDSFVHLEILSQDLLGLDPENADLLGRVAKLQRELTGDRSLWVPVLRKRAELMAARERWDDAATDLRAVVEAGNVLPGDWVILSEAEAKLGNTEQSHKALAKAAASFEAEGRPERAADLWEMLVEEDPSNRAANDRLAELREKLGDVDSFVQQMERLAAQALEKGDDGRAVECYEAILRKSEEHATARRQLAILQARLGDGAASARHLVRLGPDALDEELVPAAEAAARSDLDAEFVRTNAAALERVSVLLEAENRPEAAAPLLAALSEADGSRVSVLSRLAAVYTKTGNPDGARAVYVRLGELHRVKGEQGEARAAFEEAIRIDPQDGFALRQLYELSSGESDPAKAFGYGMQLAGVFAELGAEDDEKDLLHELIKNQPDNIEARERLAGWYLRREDNEAAAEQFRQLYEIHKTAGNLDAASGVLQRLEQVDGENPATLELLADVYRSLHDDTQAGNYLKRSAERYAETDRLEDSLRICESLSQLAPHDEELRVLRAEVLERAGEYTRAAAAWEEAADILHAEERPEEQLLALQRAVSLAPENDRLQERLAQLCSDLDRTSEAGALFAELAARHEESGNVTAAMDALTTACRLVPDSRELHERLAHLASARKDSAVARAEHVWLAEKSEQTGDAMEALEHYRRALEIAGDATLELKTARLLRQAGELAEAWALLRAIPGHGKEASSSGEFREELLRLYEKDPGREGALAFLLEHLGPKEGNGEAGGALLKGVDQLLRDGDVEEALQAGRAACELAGERLAVRHRLVAIYRKHGLPELAGKELLDIARELKDAGEEEKALEAVEEALRDRKGDVGGRRMRFDLLLALDRIPEATEEGVSLIESYRRASELDEALLICRELVARAGTAPEPRRLLAAILKDRGETTQQIRELRSLAEICLEREEYTEAVRTLKELLQIRPDDTKARLYYIDAYRQIGPEVDLVQDYLRLADIHNRHGAYHQATKVYERLLSIAPERPEVHIQFVDYLMENGQSTRAVTQAITLADLLLEREEPREALRQLQRIREAAKDSSAYYMALARMNVAMDARGTAAEAMEKAAVLERQAGNEARRAEILRDLLSLDPLDIEVHRALIDSLTQAGASPEEIRRARFRLAEACSQRGKPDLAEEEFRGNIAADRGDLESWRALVELRRQASSPTGFVEDLLQFARALVQKKEFKEAIETYLNVLEIEPRNIEAHRGYVRTYPKVGKESDIVEDILRFAQLLIEQGEIDEGLRYFELVMSIDPQNTVARDMITSTQARLKEARAAEARAAGQAAAPTPDPNRTHTQKSRSRTRQGASAEDFLRGELEEMERKESSEALAQVVSNYQDILAVNTQNANVRVKLADVLEQMGRVPEMLDQLSIAAESYFQRGDLPSSIQCCERYLKLNPGDGKVRKRLNEAILKRDAFKALESAILFTDREPPTKR